MNLDQIDQMVREANPVPDPTTLEAVDESELFGSLGGHDPRSRSRSPQRVLIGIAAATALVAGTVALLALRDGDAQSGESAVAGNPATASAVETAASFFMAYRWHDIDEMTSLLSDEALDSAFGGLEELRLLLAWQRATGFRLVSGACAHHETSPAGTTVRCPYHFHALRSEEIGLDPFGGNHLDLTIVEGEIVSIVDHIPFRTNGLNDEIWMPFARWLTETYPDDVGTMYANQGLTLERITAESITMWERHTKEYVDAWPEIQQYEVGFIGLPPPGAEPSTSELTELIDDYSVDGGGPPYRGWVHLYADGRMIWSRRDAPVNSVDTGLLEQRLTPEGIELVRNHGVLAEKDPLELLDWLPDSAWEDARIRAYVPFGYGACLVGRNPDTGSPTGFFPAPGPPPDREELLALLPDGAADLLRGREAVTPLDDWWDCLALTIEDARELDVLLREGGLQQDEFRNGFVIEYHVGSEDIEESPLIVYIEPRFPDGSMTCSDCG